MKNSLYKLLLLAALISGASASASVRAQECGYSTVTIYLQDAGGHAIKNAALKFFDTRDGDDGHFKAYTRTFWDTKRNAYVSVHGMCGQHYDTAVRISAPEFEAVERELKLTFGAQGFILKLKRSGTSEKISWEKLSCATRDECPLLFGERERSQK